MPGSPSATFGDDYYRFDYQEEQVVVRMERLLERSRGGGVVCELTIESAARPRPGTLYGPKNFNLLTSSKALANELSERREDVDWTGILTQVSGIAIKRWREGEPVIDLAEVKTGEATKWLLPGFLEAHGVTVVAAGGGSGKSFFGIACALTIATGRTVLGIEPVQQCATLYLDWEAEAETHAERVRALWRGVGETCEVPPLLMLYRRQVASLAEAGAVLKRQVAEHGIRFAVLDSIGMARGGAPEDAETTIRLFAAMRSLGIPILAIDHMSKEALNNRSARKEPIGSVYTTNSARRVWVMQNAEQSGTISLALRNVKANNGRLATPLGYEVSFNEDQAGTLTSVRYLPSALVDLPSEIQPGGQKWELAAVIRDAGGRVALHVAAERMGVSVSNLGNVIRRNPTYFVRVDEDVALLAERVE